MATGRLPISRFIAERKKPIQAVIRGRRTQNDLRWLEALQQLSALGPGTYRIHKGLNEYRTQLHQVIHALIPPWIRSIVRIVHHGIQSGAQHVVNFTLNGRSIGISVNY